MLRRHFLRLLAALPALPFVGRAKASAAKICPVCGSIMPRGAAYAIGSMRNSERLPDWCTCADPDRRSRMQLPDAGDPLHCWVYDGTKWFDVTPDSQRPRV